jgi:ABC-type lipoprotein release transport system permease subunit
MAGIALGVAAALGLTRIMISLLVGVSPTDFATFALVPTLLLTIAAVATYIPALRATLVDPVDALRNE